MVPFSFPTFCKDADMDWPNSRIMKHGTDLETGNFKGVKDQACPLNMAASLMWLMDMGLGNSGSHPGHAGRATTMLSSGLNCFLPLFSGHAHT